MNSTAIFDRDFLAQKDTDTVAEATPSTATRWACCSA